MAATVITATLVTGTGTGSSPYYKQYDLSTDAGADGGTLAITHGLNLDNLVSQSGGNAATPTTGAQALMFSLTPTNAAGTLGGAATVGSAFYVSAVGNTSITVATGKNGGTARLTVWRSLTNGF